MTKYESLSNRQKQIMNYIKDTLRKKAIRPRSVKLARLSDSVPVRPYTVIYQSWKNWDLSGGIPQSPGQLMYWTMFFGVKRRLQPYHSLAMLPPENLYWQLKTSKKPIPCLRSLSAAKMMMSSCLPFTVAV